MAMAMASVVRLRARWKGILTRTKRRNGPVSGSDKQWQRTVNRIYCRLCSLCAAEAAILSSSQEDSFLQRMSKVAHANGSPLRVHARRPRDGSLQEVYHVSIDPLL